MLEAWVLTVISLVLGNSIEFRRQVQQLEGRIAELEKENAQLKGHERELKEQNARLRSTTLHDPMTGLKNRRGFEEVSVQVHALAVRKEQSFCVCMIDIDHFKSINDNFGHDAGDAVLNMVALELSGLARASDCVARWGGEEFIFLLPNTSREQACIFLDRVRSRLAGSTVEFCGKEIGVTVSIGLVEWSQGISFKDLLSAADKAMYQAKRTGRNRVCVHTIKE